MRFNASVFVLLATSSLLLWGQSSAKQLQFPRVLNQAGWEIPGLRGASIKAGTTAHSSAQATDFAYQVTVLVPRREKHHFIVPLITVDTTRQLIVYKQLRFKPTEIHRFETKGKPYCYQVSGMIYSQSPDTKTAGWAGTVDFLYYDETGSGTWTILDTGGRMLPEVPRPVWAEKK